LVLDDLRRDLAVRYLSGAEVSIAEVGFMMGFSDQSAFHKAFVRWTGETPGAFRRARRAEAVAAAR
jgi:AraC-like DNA-binding protein